ncbi:MAG: multicopper oxidase domain-containing protein [Dehalococcoidia bacterium]
MRQHQNFIAGTVAAIVIVPLAVLFSAVITAGRTSAGSTGGTNGAGGSISIELGDLYVKPSKINVAPGQKVTLVVTNAGSVQHDLKVNGTEGTELIAPGKSQTIEIGPFDASTQAWCTVPGHKQAGMILNIEVAGAAASSGSGTHAMTATQNGNNATIDANATPAAGWKPFDPALKPAPGGTEHKITLTAEETMVEVAPGVKQLMFTFNQQFPGPVIRAKVGDIVTVTLENKGTMGHSIDFHASKVAWNDEMRTINPGESLVYQFEAKFAGAFMYHCGTAPALHHIGNGMHGAIIIDPPGLAAVDHEYIFMQSELYLGPNGEAGDLDKMMAEQFDAVVFNGYYNQYKFAPIRVEPGQRIRAWVVDDGPNENSAFHIVGTVFDTVFKEGAYTLKPDASKGGAQALDLQPSQGGFVEFTFDEKGFYPIVTHKFANASKGALGLFQAGDVTLAAGAGH